MKTLCFTLLIIAAFCSFLSADEIYLNDLNVINGKIIQVTDKNVEYSQEGKPFLIVPREKVFKIKYENGQVVQIAEIKGTDKIFLKNGSVVEGNISKVTSDVIIYNAGNKQEAIVRADVIKIVYADGKVIQISTEPARQITAGNEPESEPEPPPVIREGGFLDSYLWFGAFGAASVVFGNLNNKEENAYLNNRNQLSSYPFWDTKGPHTQETGIHGGFNLDLMFPAVKYLQAKGFSLTGLKFGLKTTYIFSRIDQTLNDDSLPDDEDRNGILLKYRSVNAGPEINLVFSPRSDLFNMAVQFYILGGYIHNGELTAAPGLRDAGVSLNESDYKADFNGYSGTIGASVNFALNKFPIIIGSGVFYSYSRIKFDRNVPVYNGKNRASFDEFGYSISIGFHL